MKGAVTLDLDPLTTIPSTPAGTLTSRPTEKAEPRAQAKPAVAVVTPVASVDPQLQKTRDDGRRRILDNELDREEKSLADARKVLTEEQQNPTLIAAVRVAQEAADPTPSELVEFRKNIDKASGRIRGLQATVVEHEKNIEAIKKELGALKP
jgi:chromosome segregation ATPase